jgi:hypothetical protein
MLFVFIGELHAVDIVLTLLLSVRVAGGKNVLTYMHVLGNNLQPSNYVPAITE